MLAVVSDTWVHELQDRDFLYTEVTPKDLFAHLQVECTGRHSLDLLTLHNEMQRYHLEVKGLPEYINMLKDAQRQASRAGRKIADKTLLLFRSTAMLTSERFRAQIMIGKRAWRETRHGHSGNPPTSGPMPRQESRH